MSLRLKTAAASAITNDDRGLLENPFYLSVNAPPGALPELV